MPAKILLIEDDRSKGTPIKAALEGDGHQVVWIISVRGARPSRLVAVEAASNEPITLYPGTFEVAVVDGYLKDSKLQGWEIIPALVAADVICIANSGGGEFNPRLLEAGAQLASRKEDLIKNSQPLIEQAQKLRSALLG